MPNEPNIEKLENTDTAVLILAAAAVARSAGGRSISLGADQRVRWQGEHDRARRVAGVQSRASITAARWTRAETIPTHTVVVNGL